MTSSAYFHHLPTDLGCVSEEECSQGLKSELVFVQSLTGYYLSFHWQQVSQYNITPEQILGHRIDGNFGPVALSSYLEQVQQVVSNLSPQCFSGYFHCFEQTLLFDLVISPIWVPNQKPTAVLVMGQMAPPTEGTLGVSAFQTGPSYRNGTVGALNSHSTASLSTDNYQKLLTQIAWNIRRTLDLPTIWQQTVQGLGKALRVSRCTVCPYEALVSTIEVVAEYCQEPFDSMLDLAFEVTEGTELHEALTTLKPVVIQNHDRSTQDSVQTDFNRVGLSTPSSFTLLVKQPHFQQCSLLIVATCYQDQPNGIILLQQCDRPRVWTEAELEFVRELADQVGTAVAHATLFAASQSLATELQRANSSLLQKHRELEEATQQAEEASRLKSEFLAKTSHELRTPLNGMIGFLKLILEGMADDPVEQTEFIDEAYRSALHLLNIINDILDIAKIEAGKLQIELSPVKLDELLNDVEGFTRSQVHQKNLSFEIQKPPTDDEIILYGNYQRLLQVMLNLVGNAIKFTHEGGITIGVEIIKKKVSVQNQELPGTVKVRVVDTGIGVSLDKQDKLFQSFSQVDGSRTRQYEGTGLGLAISQKLVEAMGGEVNFYSLGEGLGSTVTFTVPLFQEPIMITSQPADSSGPLRLSQTLFRGS